ncbi:MAG: autotransporter-associated beta strand repeat-containing protein [Lysobacter sp.]
MNSTITNSGTIAAGAGSTIAIGYAATATDAKLVITDGSQILGNVDATAASNATFALGGAVDQSFDVGLIGVQYLGFVNYSQESTGVSTLTGTSSLLTPWTIRSGALRISDDSQLGNSSGALSFAANGGGQLQVAANMTATRDILLAGNGAIQVDNAVTYSHGGALSGAGGLTKSGAGIVSLAGNSSYTGATTIQDGTLALVGATSLANSGSVTLAAPGVFDISATTGGSTINNLGGAAGSIVNLGGQTLTSNHSAHTLFAGAINGTGGLIKTGSSALILSGANTYLGDTSIQAGTLALSGSGRVSDSRSVSIADGAALDIAATTAGATVNGLSGSAGAKVTLGNQTLTSNHNTDTLFAGTIGGSGGLTKVGIARLTLSGVNAYTGSTIVQAGALVLSGGGSIANSKNLSLADGTLFDIAATTAGATVNDLSGAATATVTLGNQTLTGNNNSDSLFAGTINGLGGLNKTGVGVLSLSGANTYTGSTAIQGGTLALNGAGTVASSKNVSVGDGGILDIAATNAGATVNDLSGSAGSAINLGAQTLTSNHLTDTVFAGRIGGAGGVTKTGAGSLTLSGNNAYTGSTAVQAGALALSGGGSIASSKNLSLADGTTFDIAATTAGATVNDLSGAATAKVVLGNQTLTGNNNSNTLFAGTINGAGGLTKTGAGVLTLSGANTYTGTTSIDAGTLTLTGTGRVSDSKNVSLGSRGVLDISATTAGASVNDLIGQAGANINLGNQALTANSNTDTRYAGAIGGAGSVIKIGAGALSLDGASTYTGGTALRKGRLNLGHNQALGTGALAMDDGTTLGFNANGLTVANNIVLTGKADPVIDTGAFSETLSGAVSGGGFITKQGSGTLTLTGANTYTGATQVAQGRLKAGAANTFSAASAHSVASGATLDLAGFNQSIPSLSNSGTVSLVGTRAGTTLTVNGAYVGNNSVLQVGTALNGVGPSDRLILNGAGASASGKTTVQVTNIDGLGALTHGAGIEVITAQNGATTSAQTTRDAFALANAHVDAGAYEYRLYAGDEDGHGENWYLRSDYNANGSNLTAYRPAAAMYGALSSQFRQSSLATLGDRHKRVGDDEVGATRSTSSEIRHRVWARAITVNMNIQQSGTVSPTSEGRLNGVQIGAEPLIVGNWSVGAYLSSVEGDTQVSGFASAVRRLKVGRNVLRSKNVGLYVTYVGDNGFYADAVLQPGRLRYSIEPTLSARTRGEGRDMLASLELGKGFALGEHWSIEPQLHFIHQQSDFDDAVIAGAVIRQQTASGWITRAGLRLKGDIDTSAGMLQAYARVNVYKTQSGTDIARFFNGNSLTNVYTPAGGVSSEFAAGFTFALSTSTSVYAEAGKLWSSSGDTKIESSVNGSLGVLIGW